MGHEGVDPGVVAAIVWLDREVPGFALLTGYDGSLAVLKWSAVASVSRRRPGHREGEPSGLTQVQLDEGGWIEVQESPDVVWDRLVEARRADYQFCRDMRLERASK